MRGEELAGRVNQHVVQMGLEPTSLGQPEAAANSVKLRNEGIHPPGLFDGDPALGDFPRVAHPWIESRLVLETMPRRSGDCTQAARRARRDGETDPAYASDLEVKIFGGDGQARCE